jgi:hypothetical protein
MEYIIVVLLLLHVSTQLTAGTTKTKGSPFLVKKENSFQLLQRHFTIQRVYSLFLLDKKKSMKIPDQTGWAGKKERQKERIETIITEVSAAAASEERLFCCRGKYRVVFMERP